jgi:hypothetical protein
MSASDEAIRLALALEHEFTDHRHGGGDRCTRCAVPGDPSASALPANSRRRPVSAIGQPRVGRTANLQQEWIAGSIQEDGPTLSRSLQSWPLGSGRNNAPACSDRAELQASFLDLAPRVAQRDRAADGIGTRGVDQPIDVGRQRFAPVVRRCPERCRSTSRACQYSPGGKVRDQAGVPSTRSRCRRPPSCSDSALAQKRGHYVRNELGIAKAMDQARICVSRALRRSVRPQCDAASGAAGAQQG